MNDGEKLARALSGSMSGKHAITTPDDLLKQKRHLVTVIIGLENKDRLGHDGLDLLRKTRADLRAVKEQIAKEECGE